MVKFKEVLDAARAAPLELMTGQRETRSSPLHRWMRDNYDELEKAIRDVGWKRIWAGIVEMGLRDATGKLPSKRRCEQTFYRVSKEKRLARGNQAPAKVIDGERRGNSPQAVERRQADLGRLLPPAKTPRPMD